MGFFKNLFSSNKEDSKALVTEELPQVETPENTLQEDTESTNIEEHEKRYRFETLRDDGLRALQIGQVEYAVKCFTTALQYEENSTTMRHLAESYVMIRDGEKALALLERLHEEDPENVDYPIIATQAAEIAEQYDTMERYARMAIEIDPNNETGLYMLGHCLFLKKQYADAEECFTQLLATSEEFSNVRQQRINCRIEEEKYNEALEDIAYMTNHASATEDTYIAKGNILLKQGEYEAAADAYKEALTLNPFNMAAPLKLAETSLSQAHPDEALAYLDEAISMQENFAEAYNKRAEIKEQLGDNEGAIQDREKAQNITLTEEHSEGNLEERMNDRYKSMNPYGF